MATHAGIFTQPALCSAFDGMSTDLLAYSEEWVNKRSAYSPPAPIAAPISSRPYAPVGSRTISGIATCAFGPTDYYDRIHVIPSVLALGNIVSESRNEVVVWNAFRNSAHLMSGISITANQGITIYGSISAPHTFEPLSEAIFDIVATTTGPATTDALVVFVFDVGSSPIHITAKRAEMLIYPPIWEATETLTWSTDVMQAVAAEQRMALLETPRRTIGYSWVLDRKQYSYMRAQAHGWGARSFVVPVWFEKSTDKVTVAAGDEAVYFDTSAAGYRAGDLCVIIGGGKAEGIEVSAVYPDRLEFKFPAAGTTHGYIMPTVAANALDGFAITRDGSEFARVSADFTVMDVNPDLSVEGATTYQGLPVLTEPTAFLHDVSESISHPAVLFDWGAGPIEIDEMRTWPKSAQTIGFVVHDRQAVWRVKQWLYARRGRQRAFWLPSWNTDLVPTSNIYASNLTFQAESSKWEVYYPDGAHIMIMLKSGARHYRRVSRVSGLTVTLETAVSANIYPGDIDRVSILSKVRLDADRVEVEHKGGGTAVISAMVVEVP